MLINTMGGVPLVSLALLRSIPTLNGDTLVTTLWPAFIAAVR